MPFCCSSQIGGWRCRFDILVIGLTDAARRLVFLFSFPKDGFFHYPVGIAVNDENVQFPGNSIWVHLKIGYTVYTHHMAVFIGQLVIKKRGSG